MNICVNMHLPRFEQLDPLLDWLAINVGEVHKDWCYLVVPGKGRPPEDYRFFFNHRNPAMMFKLTWAGCE